MREQGYGNHQGSGPLRVAAGLLALTGLVVLAFWNWSLAQNGSYRFGRCVVAARPLTAGTRVADGGKDVSEWFCRRPDGETVVGRTSEAVTKYVKAARIEEGQPLKLEDLQGSPAEASKMVQVFVKIAENRGACLRKGDHLLLVQSPAEDAEDGRPKIVPDPRQGGFKEGFEVLSLWPSEEEKKEHGVILAVPAGFWEEAAQIAQGEWSPVLLDPKRAEACEVPKPPAPKPNPKSKPKRRC